MKSIAKGCCKNALQLEDARRESKRARIEARRERRVARGDRRLEGVCLGGYWPDEFGTFHLFPHNFMRKGFYIIFS